MSRCIGAGVRWSFLLSDPLLPRRLGHRNYTRTEEFLAEMVLTYWTNFITSGWVAGRVRQNGDHHLSLIHI